MDRINIRNFRKEYNQDKISDEELEKIHNFFNQDEFLNILKEKEQLYQKLKWPLYFLALLLIIGNIYILLNYGFSLIILYSWFLFLIIGFLVNKLQIWNSKWIYEKIKEFIFQENNNNLSKEEKVFSGFVENMFEWAKFSLSSDYFEENPKDIKEKTNLLGSYQRVDKFWNSTKYQFKDSNWNHVANITWAEIKTKKRKKTKNWSKTVTVDHIFVQKINVFSEDKLFDWILITQKDHLLEIIVKYLVLFVFIFILIIFFSPFSIILSVLLSVIILILIWWVNKKRWEKVELEDAEFEKNFDIRSEDQIEARNLMDSRTITAIKDLTKKFPNKKFDFYIEWNEIYVLVHLNKDFLSLWNYLFLNRTLKGYIDFYIMLREIYNIPVYLNIDYHTNN